jgi:hypothetical protein
MPEPMKLELQLPRNPDFGSGLVRRVIRLENLGNAEVVAHLIDNYHEMRCRLQPHVPVHPPV